MKKWFPVLLLLTFLFPVSGLCAPFEDPTIRSMELLPGTLTLDRGVLFSGETNSKAAERTRLFLMEIGIPVDPPKKNKKLPRVEWRTVETVGGMPPEIRDGYRIRIDASGVRIEYTSPRAAAVASRLLKDICGAGKTGYPPRSKTGHNLSCADITGWIFSSSTVAYRLPADAFYPADYIVEHLHELVPVDADRVEILFTHPQNGWYIPGESMRVISPGYDIYRDEYYTYTAVSDLYDYLGSHSMELVPVFDLTADNLWFEEVTGHKMLSVEGFRFVKALLSEFMRNSRCDTVLVVLGDSKYREQLIRVTEQASLPVNLIFSEE